MTSHVDPLQIQRKKTTGKGVKRSWETSHTLEKTRERDPVMEWEEKGKERSTQGKTEKLRGLAQYDPLLGLKSNDEPARKGTPKRD